MDRVGREPQRQVQLAVGDPDPEVVVRRGDQGAQVDLLALQRELTLTEDRIAAARRFYNANVRAYNTRVRTVPSNLVAAAFRFRTRDFFELDDAARASVPGAGRAG